MRDTIVIDTDGGVDDAVALLLAGASPEIALRRITTVAGNVAMRQAVANVRRVASIAPALKDVAVNPGHERPLVRALHDATEIHGLDGLGGLESLRNPDGSVRYPALAAGREEPFAVPRILDDVATDPDAITLLAIGPLTNVAAAYLADPVTFGRLRRLVIMGGAVHGRGNVTPHAEYNFFVDPEAVGVILTAPVEKLLVPLEVCEQVVLTRHMVAEWSEQHPSPTAWFVRDITGHYMEFHRQHAGIDGCHPHDAIALAAILKPSLFQWERVRLSVELSAEDRRGQLRLAGDGSGGVITVATAIDAAMFLDLLRERVWERQSLPGRAATSSRRPGRRT